jgi:hypothetical protein
LTIFKNGGENHHFEPTTSRRLRGLSLVLPLLRQQVSGIDQYGLAQHDAIKSTILEADETGTLHLPPSLLPHPGPGRRYRVAAEGAQVVVDEVIAQAAEAGSRDAWLAERERRRSRGVTGKTGTPLQAILDDIRGEPS